MAMDLATGAMGSLLLKLGELLTEEYKLQAKVKEDVEYLKRELTSMYAALRTVGDVPRDELDEQVKIWADDVRDISYRMEGIVDKFLVRVEGSKAPPAAKPCKLKRLMKKMSGLFTTGMTRHKISDEIKVIKARVQEAADRRDRYKVNDVVASPAGSATVDPRLLALYKDQKELVGIDDSLNVLTKMLSDGDGNLSKQLKILSIAGCGGLGKTTLAKAVYDELQGQFDYGAFVPVGRNPSRQKLLNDILFGINKQMYQGLDNRQLIDELRALLKNKRYFIVIDDIWDEETWSIIKCAFVDNNCGSRIITTTRILEVATATGEVYKLKPLSQELSEELFNTRLLGDKSEHSYGQPTEAYDKILHKCGGIPLAIATMASLLVGKPVESWSKIYKSIGFGNEDNKDVNNMRKILLFSYYDLPCHLRACLLYLSIYPEDHMIAKDSLILKWVAEGFVHQEAEVGLSETAERYFNELIDKSMIEPVERPQHDGIIGCRVHDMVFDMINVIAKEENFVTVLDRYQQFTSSDGNARRLAVGRRLALYHARPREVQGLTHVLSLTILGEAHPSVLDFSKYELLRVLDLEECYVPLGDGHLKLICTKLLLLRYLCLGFAVIATTLPKEIRKLQLLDTLDVRRTNIEILPTQVMELPCLVHLFGKFKLEQKQDAGGRRMSKLQTWLSVKSKLETLPTFVVNNSNSQEFAQLMDHMWNLTKVKIWCKATTDTSSSSHLSKAIKGFIERNTDFTRTLSLSLDFEGELSQDMLNFSLEKGRRSCCYLGSLKLQGSKICSLPPFVYLLGCVTKLVMSSPQLSLSQDFIAALNSVPGLEYLKIVAISLEKLVITKGSLNSLVRLSIVVESMPGQLEIQEGALPRLKWLQLLCKDLVGSISGMSAVQSLGHLKGIALHREVGDETKNEWKEAARKHPRCPKILFV